MIGIMLAGGAASRLPNKPLLPMHDGRPVIVSGLDLLTRCKCSPIVVVVPPFSVIPDVLRCLSARRQGYFYAQQIEPTGVPHAITIGLAACEHREGDVAVVVCCDNIYPRHFDEHVGDPRYNTALVGRVAPHRASHLAKYNPKTSSYYRDGSTAGWCLLTPWSLVARDVALSKPREDTTSFLTRVGAVAICESNTEGWWDVGTGETYHEYWRQATVRTKTPSI